MSKSWLISLLCLCFVGCTTVSKEECSVDWEQEGFKAGFWNKDTRGNLGFYQKFCEKDHDIKIDTSKFDSGFKRGRNELCTQEGGYKFGRGGGVYSDICPKEKEEAFFGGYQRGQAIYSTSRIQVLESEMTTLNKQLKAKQDQIDDLESKQKVLKRELEEAKRK